METADFLKFESEIYGMDTPTATSSFDTQEFAQSYEEPNLNSLNAMNQTTMPHLQCSMCGSFVSARGFDISNVALSHHNYPTPATSGSYASVSAPRMEQFSNNNAIYGTESFLESITSIPGEEVNFDMLSNTASFERDNGRVHAANIDSPEEASSPDDVQTNQPTGRRYPCPYHDCNKSFTRKGDAKRHAKLHGKTRDEARPFRCSQDGCKFKTIGFARKDKLVSHVYKVHNIVEDPVQPTPGTFVYESFPPAGDKPVTLRN